MTHVHRVLIVEDDDDQREPLTLLFEMSGYDVTASNSAEAAMGLLQNGLRPCVIILDLMMPKMDGLAFRHAQLLDPDLSDIPVILYSGGGNLSETAKAMRADGYVEKPGNLDVLFGLVKRYC
jgi:two-component system chemotaxis response regulator CheY